MKERVFVIDWKRFKLIWQTGRTVARYGMLLTKVFMKVLADGINSAKVLSFSSSFGRPNTMRDNRARIEQWNKN